MAHVSSSPDFVFLYEQRQRQRQRLFENKKSLACTDVGGEISPQKLLSKQTQLDLPKDLKNWEYEGGSTNTKTTSKIHIYIYI